MEVVIIIAIVVGASILIFFVIRRDSKREDPAVEVLGLSGGRRDTVLPPATAQAHKPILIGRDNRREDDVAEVLGPLEKRRDAPAPPPPTRPLRLTLEEAILICQECGTANPKSASSCFGCDFRLHKE